MTENERLTFETELGISIDKNEDCPTMSICWNCDIKVKDCKYFNDVVEKLAKYEAIGTIEELQKSVKEEDVLKFYYIESEDKYVVGKRIDTLYYAEVGKTGLCFYMSRYLPWGKDGYSSEPKEIPFFDWLQGFMKKEYGGTIDEFKALKEKSVAKKVNIQQWIDTKCDCGYEFSKHHGDGYYSIPYEKQTKYCPECGRKLDWD